MADYSCFSVTSVTMNAYDSFEHMHFRFKFSSQTCDFVTVYRLPSDSHSEFLSDFSDFLEEFAITVSESVM